MNVNKIQGLLAAVSAAERELALCQERYNAVLAAGLPNAEISVSIGSDKFAVSYFDYNKYESKIARGREMIYLGCKLAAQATVLQAEDALSAAQKALRDEVTRDA